MNFDEKYKICLDHAVMMVMLLIEKDQVTTDKLTLAINVNSIARELMLAWK